MRLFPTLATLLMFAIAPLSLHAQEGVNEAAMEKLGWKISMQCWTFHHLTLFEAIDDIAALGVRNVELYPNQKLGGDSKGTVNPAMSAADLELMKAKLSAAKIQPVAYGVVRIPTDETAARALFTWAKSLGISTFNTEPKLENKEHLALIDRLSKEYGFSIGLHNHPKPSVYWNPDTVLATIADRSNPRFGFCADTGHWYRSDLSTIECLKKSAGHVVSVHFKDLDENKHDVPYGTGVNHAADQLAELKAMNFRGVISIEYEKYRNNPAELNANLKTCIHFLNAQAEKLAK